MSAPAEVQEVGQVVERALVVHEKPTTPTAIIALLELAIERGIPVEALERLQALHERVSDRAAAAEFAQAVASFQAKCPPIGENKIATIASRSGTAFSYKYAELDHIARVIAPVLQEVGLAYSWDSDMADKMVRCTCRLRHVNGHSVTASFTCPVESAAGMSEQQKHAAALSFARRQSLIQVLGLTTCDPDTDGADPARISTEQVNDLEALISELKVNKDGFLAWAKVSSLAEIPARNYEAAVRAVRNAAAQRERAGQAKQ